MVMNRRYYDNPKKRRIIFHIKGYSSIRVWRGERYLLKPSSGMEYSGLGWYGGDVNA